MRDVQDHSTLKWIRPELEALVDRSRHALEAYVDNPDDGEQIEQCISALHQTRGTLQLVQLYGAAMLAEEMALVATAMRNGKIRRVDEAAETLMLGMVHLPDYLEKLESGSRDIPLLILPMLNELRAARDAALLSEVALFSPELEQRLEQADGDGDPNPDLPAVARRLRLHYHKGLLEWYRESDIEGGLRGIAGVLSELEQEAGTEVVKRQFQAGRAVAEGLREGTISTGIATKELFGKLDRVIKRVIDEGEQSVVAAPASELMKNLLYYVANADSVHPLLDEVKRHFALDQGFFSRSEMERERQGLQAPGHDLMSSVKSAIEADLVRIKDGLDLYIRGQGDEMERLLALRAPMQTVADTLGMIGQGALRERLKRQVERIVEAEDAGQIPDEQTLLAMAGDILFVETSLENLASSRPAYVSAAPADSGLSALPAGEFEKLVDTVMHEAEVDIARNKEAIIDFIENPDKPVLLDAVSERFLSVAGAFRIMNLQKASELLAALSRYVSETLASSAELPKAADLNLFADAMTSIEYFMETVTEGRGVKEEILDVAVSALRQLGLGAPTLKRVDEPAADEIGADVAEAPGEPSTPVDLVAEQAQAEPTEALASADKPPLEEIEPEILEIFLEESKEELAVIAEYLPRWCDNTDDREALTMFRRSFHTLKGSGRLVGAETIGEFAWSIENLLNRVIDETVPISPQILTLLRDALEELPGLVEAQESGQAPTRDVTPLMERAFALATPGQVPSAREEAAQPLVQELGQSTQAIELEAVGEAETSADIVPFPSPEQAGQAPQEADSERVAEVVSKAEPELPAAIEMDPGLLEIFGPETRGHVQELRSFVADCRLEPQACDLRRGDISRALHTLHGSADMAGVKPIALISSALEFLVSDLEEHQPRADEPMLNLIENAMDMVDRVLQSVNEPGSQLPKWGQLVDDIDARRQQLREVESITPDVETTVPEVEMAPETEIASAPETAVVAVSESAAASQLLEDAASQSMDYEEVEGDEELTEIFLEEARELYEAAERDLQEWRASPDDLGLVPGLERTLHTLKGGARLCGVMSMGDLCHAFESLLSGIGNRTATATPAFMEIAQLVVDRLAEQIDDLSQGPRVRTAADLVERLQTWNEAPGALEPAPDEATAVVDALSQTAEEAAAEPEPAAEDVVQPDDTAEAAPTEESVAEVVAIDARSPASEPGRQTPAPVAIERRATRREQIRVQADLLDRLVNNAGEVSIYRARLEQQSGALGFNLSELEQTVERLRNQLRKLEIETEAQILFRYDREKEAGSLMEEAFDPLELDRFSTMQQLSRSLMETVNDLSNLNGYLDELHKETDTLLQQQARVASDLQDGLLRTRMVPFVQLVPRLQRVVRQTANTLDKKAELEVHGAEGELDRGILDRMIGPLEHLLRNAVSHGVEMPEQRRESGKPEIGRISLFLKREGNDVLLTISDDGCGLDTRVIRQHAIELGLLDPQAEVPDTDILQFVLEHGFSTQTAVNQISGRGVGLDVVVKEVKQLGGSLDINSQAGQGTSFIIRLPLTLAISDALLVELGDEIYAISHTSIEGVVRASRQELLDCYEGRTPFYSYADHDYRVRYLGAMLGVSQLNLAEQRKWHPLLLVRAGEHHVALQVDGLLGNRQIVVKSVGPQISSVRWISGGTILGDGRVALILDVTALVRMDAAHTIPTEPEAARQATAATGRTIMVVDDSITVRKVTGRVLERNGMTVVTAKDGVDAVALLQEHRPDLMLLDIEMPRMDGYELARHMRNTEQLKDIPIIMITSRTGDKHRRLAMELGVKRYLGKPYQETELLDNISAVLAEAGR